MDGALQTLRTFGLTHEELSRTRDLQGLVRLEASWRDFAFLVADIPACKDQSKVGQEVQSRNQCPPGTRCGRREQEP